MLKEGFFWLILVLMFACFWGEEVRPLIEKNFVGSGFWVLESIFGWLQANWGGRFGVGRALMRFITMVHILDGVLSLVDLA